MIFGNYKSKTVRKYPGFIWGPNAHKYAFDIEINACKFEILTQWISYIMKFTHDTFDR